MGCQRNGEGVDYTQGRSLGLIADCRFHILGIQRLNPQAETKEVLPTVRAEVCCLLVEQPTVELGIISLRRGLHSMVKYPCV